VLNNLISLKNNLFYFPSKFGLYKTATNFTPFYFSFKEHPNIEALASQDSCGIQKVFAKKTIAHPRIIGGDVAGIGQFPWIANLVQGTPGLNNYQPVCGGSLIGPRIVLTVAHCLFGPPDHPITTERFVQM
jgi:hypothetical protein